jgi:hypothetical protein
MAIRSFTLSSGGIRTATRSGHGGGGAAPAACRQLQESASFLPPRSLPVRGAINCSRAGRQEVIRAVDGPVRRESTPRRARAQERAVPGAAPAASARLPEGERPIPPAALRRILRTDARTNPRHRCPDAPSAPLPGRTLGTAAGRTLGTGADARISRPQPRSGVSCGEGSARSAQYLRGPLTHPFSGSPDTNGLTPLPVQATLPTPFGPHSSTIGFASRRHGCCPVRG